MQSDGVYRWRSPSPILCHGRGLLPLRRSSGTHLDLRAGHNEAMNAAIVPPGAAKVRRSEYTPPFRVQSCLSGHRECGFGSDPTSAIVNSPIRATVLTSRRSND